MDPVRFGKNLLMALVLLGVIAVLHQSDLPATQRLEEYIAFVVTTDWDYAPLVEVSQSLGAWMPGDGWLSRWARLSEPAP